MARDLEQVYVCLGARGVAAGDARRFVATMLQLILGGNMSSRLFQVIREQLGLAYSIYAFLSFFSDTGLLGRLRRRQPQKSGRPCWPRVPGVKEAEGRAGPGRRNCRRPGNTCGAPSTWAPKTWTT